MSINMKEKRKTEAHGLDNGGWIRDTQRKSTSMGGQKLICDTGAQNPSLVVFGFFILSYSTLHLLQNTFYSIEISCF